MLCLVIEVERFLKFKRGEAPQTSRLFIKIQTFLM